MWKNIFNLSIALGSGSFLGYKYGKADVFIPAEHEEADKNLPFGDPHIGPQVLRYTHHTLLYDQAKRQPLWVAEHLNESHLKGDANRPRKFSPDPNVSRLFSAENRDYSKSRWSKGHMAAAGNNEFHQGAMNETFYLSNVVPQDLKNNNGFWNRFEMYCRDLTNSFSDVWIISGPAYLPYKDEKKKTMFKFEAIGENLVPVPTHLYKVVMVKDSNEEYPYALGAFMVPNKPLGYEQKLKSFQVPLESVEKSTGIKFHPDLDFSLVNDLCKIDDCQLISEQELMEYIRCIFKRQMTSAEDIKSLEKIWVKLNAKNIEITEELENLYQMKKSQLTEEEEIGEEKALNSFYTSH